MDKFTANSSSPICQPSYSKKFSRQTECWRVGSLSLGFRASSTLKAPYIRLERCKITEKSAEKEHEEYEENKREYSEYIRDIIAEDEEKVKIPQNVEASPPDPDDSEVQLIRRSQRVQKKPDGMTTTREERKIQAIEKAFYLMEKDKRRRQASERRDKATETQSSEKLQRKTPKTKKRKRRRRRSLANSCGSGFLSPEENTLQKEAVTPMSNVVPRSVPVVETSRASMNISASCVTTSNTLSPVLQSVPASSVLNKRVNEGLKPGRKRKCGKHTNDTQTNLLKGGIRVLATAPPTKERANKSNHFKAILQDIPSNPQNKKKIPQPPREIEKIKGFLAEDDETLIIVKWKHQKEFECINKKDMTNTDLSLFEEFMKNHTNQAVPAMSQVQVRHSSVTDKKIELQNLQNIEEFKEKQKKFLKEPTLITDLGLDIFKADVKLRIK